MTQYQIGTVKKRTPQAVTQISFRPRGNSPFGFRSSRQDSLSGVMHDFSRISIHAPGQRATLASTTLASGGLYERDGGTGCDASTGTAKTEIYDPPACYRDCVSRHEAVHAHDIAPCCARANAAYKAAKSDDDKQAVQKKIEEWTEVDTNQDWFECRAYKTSAKCGREYLNKNCGYKIEEAAPQSLSGTEGKPATSMERADQPAPMASEPTSFARNGVLAEDKPEGGAGTPVPADKRDAGTDTPGPDKCCPVMLRYWRVSQGRADNLCGRAPKALTPCPF
jgi:hypothetical protein